MRQQQLSIYCRIRTQLSRHSVSSAALVTLALIVLASLVILFVNTSSLRVLNSLGDIVGVYGDQLNNVAHGFKTSGWDADTNADSTPTPTPTPPNVILSEDFESGTLDPRISIQTTGTFSSGPGIKSISNFGSTKAFGFGRSTCNASCFSNFVTTLRVTLPAPTFVSNISFKEMELFDNWGSQGFLLIDGVRLTDSPADFGRLPLNDRQPDTTFRSRTFLIDRAVSIIELRVEDITNLSEIYIDDVAINATQGSTPTPTPTPAPGTGFFDNFESSSVGAFPAGWSNSGNSNVAIDNITHVSPTRCARLTGDSFGCWEALIHRLLNTSPPFTLEAFVYTRPQTLNGCHSWRASFFLNTGASWTTPYRQLLFFDGDLAIKGSGGLALGQYVPQTWYKVKIVYERLNVSTVRLSYWIDDDYRGSESLDAAPYENLLSYFTLASGDGPAWFDDVKVSSGTPFVAGLSLLGMLPKKGGDTGAVTTVIHGNGFEPGSTVRLTGSGPDITASATSVDPLRATINATFDLRGQARGLRNVVVTNPSGTTATLRNAFTVEAGVQARVWVDVVGRSNIRAGRAQEFTIVYGNSGNVDAAVVPLWITGIPKDATWAITSKTTENISSKGDPNLSFELEDGLVLPLLLPLVAAGTSASVSVSINVQSPSSFRLRSWASPPLSGPSQTACLERPWQKCILGLTELIVTALGHPELARFISCARSVVGGLCESNRFGLGQKIDIRSLFSHIIDSILECSGIDPGEWGNWRGMLGKAIRGALRNFWVLADCAEALRDTLGGLLDVLVGTAFDPNMKIGSPGDSAQRFVSSRPLSYSILFENLPAATLPARDVVITDQLDTGKFDLDTFRLGSISFGKWRVTPPPGLSSYSTTVDLRPANNLLVRIDAALNKTTGLLRWNFTSLDPGTNLPPEDPLAGFLPPNKVPPEGDGAVLFTISQKENLPTGTEVRNKARIVFDANAPIDTAEWLNTIDNTNPVSRVAPLSAQSPHSFQVDWSGSDIGSGLQDFTVFVSENGGPFTTWLINTSATSAIFYGKASTTYAFYSLARDSVGNHESAKTIAEATTTTLSASPIQLLLDTSGPALDQAAALDSLLFLRDPFPVVNGADLLKLGVDRNTRVIIFLTNLQLAQGETSSSVVVNLIDSKNQSYDIAAEDVRPVPNVAFTQVIFRLPNNLPAGTCTITIKAHGQISNAGTIRIRI